MYLYITLNESHSLSERRKPSLMVTSADVISSLLRYLQRTDFGSNLWFYFIPADPVWSLSALLVKQSLASPTEELSLKHSGFCNVRSLCWVWAWRAGSPSPVYLPLFLKSPFPRSVELAGQVSWITSSSTASAKEVICCFLLQADTFSMANFCSWPDVVLSPP